MNAGCGELIQDYERSVAKQSAAGKKSLTPAQQKQAAQRRKKLNELLRTQQRRRRKSSEHETSESESESGSGSVSVREGGSAKDTSEEDERAPDEALARILVWHPVADAFLCSFEDRSHCYDKWLARSLVLKLHSVKLKNFIRKYGLPEKGSRPNTPAAAAPGATAAGGGGTPASHTTARTPTPMLPGAGVGGAMDEEIEKALVEQDAEGEKPMGVRTAASAGDEVTALDEEDDSGEAADSAEAAALAGCLFAEDVGPVVLSHWLVPERICALER